MVAADRLRLVPAHLPRRHAAGVLIPPDPVDDRAHRNAELGRRPMPRQAARQHRRNDTLAKINRIKVFHLMLPPPQPDPSITTSPIRESQCDSSRSHPALAAYASDRSRAL